MTRLPLSSLVLGSFLAGAAVMFTAPQFISDAHAAKEFVAPPIREGTNPTKWEYFTKRGPSTSTMQAMGQQGWELTATSDLFYVFKRELP
jgi:hypothetical protein